MAITKSGVKSFFVNNKSVILTTTSMVTGVAATVTSVIFAPKMYDSLKGSNELIEEIKRRKSGEGVEDEEFDKKKYMKDLTVARAKQVGKAAWAMKVPIILEGISIATGIGGTMSFVKEKAALTAAAASAMSMYAWLSDGVRDKYGEDALRELEKLGIRKKTIESKDENGKKVKKEIEIAPPSLNGVDSVAYDLCKKHNLPYNLGTIAFDNRFTAYKKFGGDIGNAMKDVRAALEMANVYMWKNRKIKMSYILELLGLEDKYDLAGNPTINMSIADMIGTIDIPFAYDTLRKEWVKTPGFDDDGFACRYGEFTHKVISFGDKLDAVLAGDGYSNALSEYRPELLTMVPTKDWEQWHIVKDDEGRDVLILNISYDGNIANKDVDSLPNSVLEERRESMYEEVPWLEK